jgi:hypothetical protein
MHICGKALRSQNVLKSYGIGKIMEIDKFGLEEVSLRIMMQRTMGLRWSGMR